MKVTRYEQGQWVDYDMPETRAAVHAERARIARGAALFLFIIGLVALPAFFDYDRWLVRTFGRQADLVNTLLTMVAVFVPVGAFAFIVSWLPGHTRQWSEDADIRHFKHKGRWPDSGVLP